MSRAQFVDISGFQSLSIDFAAYRAWSAATDGIARLAIKVTEGNTFTDPHFQAYRKAAVAAGIDCILYYHFLRADLGNSPQSEAFWQAHVLGQIRASDIIMLDAETAPVTSEWVYQWCLTQQQNYPNNQIIIYSFPSFIAQHLQDSRLSAFPLILASWQYSPDETPSCPAPWTSYTYIQYTDKATQIPGIPGTVDADVYIGGITPMPTTHVPTGWRDDGTTLLAPNGIAVRNGFRRFVLNNTWDPDDYPLAPEMAVAVLEMSNPALGGGTQQMFRCSMLGWNAQVGVIHEWIGTELMAVRVALAAAQAALKDAQTQLTQCKTTLQVTGQQLAQAQAALSASPAYGVACNTISDLLKSLPRYPVTTAGTMYQAKEEAS